MAVDRPKRQNAGSRMSKLLEEQEDEEEDDFYKNTYGGFNEEEEDGDYQSEEMEEDVVDSDFSLSEREDEGETEEEDDGKRKKRKKKTYGIKPPRPDGAPKVKRNVKKVVEPVRTIDKQTRMRATTLLKGAEVAKKQSIQSSLVKRHPRLPQMRRLTQQELLAEAKTTEEQNTASLVQFLKLEEEKKNVKVTKVRYQGPIIRFQSLRMPDIDVVGDNTETIGNTFCSRNFIEFTDTKNFPKEYFPNPKVKYPGKITCVVTGRPAKYKDPATELPYATIEAFKYIRQHRKRLKVKLANAKNDSKKRKKIL